MLTPSVTLPESIEHRATNLGETVHYLGATPSECLDLLARSDGNNHFYRMVGAAGLVRGLLDTKPWHRDHDFVDAVLWASDLMLDPEDVPMELPPQLVDIGHISGQLDNVSMLATRMNDAHESARLIHERFGAEAGLLVVGIGHGGIMAATSTFRQLEGFGNSFYPVRYSRNKRCDTEPVISDAEYDYLEQEALDREILVIDEDRSRGTTISRAVTRLSDELARTVHGLTLTCANKRVYSPLFVDSDTSTLTQARQK